ncbi:unnamed protein product [Paramecium sonneborni]|uniref:Uncharacterized protein n=1 Tax=Paramecium sonneborni TaxID=65129 RepID=A0A8S1RDG0_9CILI|nr:unnamed protein product [Paramecium sonneborni]
MNFVDSLCKYQLKLFLIEVDLKLFLEGQMDNSITFKLYQKNNQFQIQISTSLDSQKIGILVQVLDSGGSIKQVYEIITPKLAQIDRVQIQFQNFNLLNKIVLLFEAMNQNVINYIKKYIIIYLIINFTKVNEQYLKILSNQIILTILNN